jgi:hypothetical protein
LFEDLAARPVGSITAVKLFNSAERPAIGDAAIPNANSPPITQPAVEQRDEVAGKASVPVKAGQMVWSNPSNLREPVVQQPVPQPAVQPAVLAPTHFPPQPAPEPVAPPALQPVSRPVAPAAPQLVPEPVAQPVAKPAAQPVSAPVVQQAFVPQAPAPESVAPSTPSLRGAASMVAPQPSSGRSEEKDVESALAAAENVQAPLAGDADDDWMEAVEGAETA